MIYEGLNDACNGNIFESLPITSVIVAPGYQGTTFCGLALIDNSCGNNCIWSFDETTNELTITGNGEMLSYTDSQPQWYDIRDKIKTVTVNGLYKK